VLLLLLLLLECDKLRADLLDDADRGAAPLLLGSMLLFEGGERCAQLLGGGVALLQ